MELRSTGRGEHTRGGSARAKHGRGEWDRGRRLWRRGLVSLAIAVLLGHAVCGCGEGGAGAGAGTGEGLVGTVQRFPLDSDNWVLIADSAPGDIYVPDAVPEPFREVGLRVRFVIERIDSPPNVRMVGIAVRLLRITREEGRSRS